MLSKEFITQAGELLKENAYDYGNIYEELKSEGHDDQEIASVLESLTAAFAEVDAIFEDKRSVSQWKRDGYVFVKESDLNETSELSDEEIIEQLIVMAEAAHEDSEDEKEEEEEEVDEATLSEVERGQKTRIGKRAAKTGGAATGVALARKFTGAGTAGQIGAGIIGAIAGGLLYKTYKKAARESERARAGAGKLSGQAKRDRLYKVRIKELNAKKAAVKAAAGRALGDSKVKNKDKVKEYSRKKLASLDNQIANASAVYKQKKAKSA